MLFILFIEQRVPKGDYDECQGPHTLAKGNGTCVCLPNFPFGNPYSKQGCYTCVDQCNDKALCIFPGKCACINGLVGDGIQNCSIPIPKLTSVDPVKISKSSITYITAEYEIPTNYTTISGFCKIGNTISKAVKITRSGFKCEVKPSDIPIQRVSISFDNNTWTEETFYIQFIDNYAPETFQIVWQIWVFVVIIIVGIYIFLRTQKVDDKKEEFTKDERQAFTAHGKDPIINHIGVDTENPEV